MKKSNLLQLITASLFVMVQMQGVSAQAEQNPAPKEVVIGINDVYVPAGFDSEADSYVIVNGIFPNGCYRWKGAEVTHSDSFHHEIKSKAMVSQGLCLMVLVPFQKEVRLGQLNSGVHKLRFVNGDGTYMEKNLKVE